MRLGTAVMRMATLGGAVFIGVKRTTDAAVPAKQGDKNDCICAGGRRQARKNWRGPGVCQRDGHLLQRNTKTRARSVAPDRWRGATRGLVGPLQRSDRAGEIGRAHV